MTEELAPGRTGGYWQPVSSEGGRSAGASEGRSTGASEGMKYHGMPWWLYVLLGVFFVGVVIIAVFVGITWTNTKDIRNDLRRRRFNAGGVGGGVGGAGTEGDWDNGAGDPDVRPDDFHPDRKCDECTKSGQPVGKCEDNVEIVERLRKQCEPIGLVLSSLEPDHLAVFKDTVTFGITALCSSFTAGTEFTFMQGLQAFSSMQYGKDAANIKYSEARFLVVFDSSTLCSPVSTAASAETANGEACVVVYTNPNPNDPNEAKVIDSFEGQFIIGKSVNPDGSFVPLELPPSNETSAPVRRRNDEKKGANLHPNHVAPANKHAHGVHQQGVVTAQQSVTGLDCTPNMFLPGTTPASFVVHAQDMVLCPTPPVTGPEGLDHDGRKKKKKSDSSDEITVPFLVKPSSGFACTRDLILSISADIFSICDAPAGDYSSIDLFSTTFAKATEPDPVNNPATITQRNGLKQRAATHKPERTISLLAHPHKHPHNKNQGGAVKSVRHH
jgi:hypothetical protein